MPATELNNLIDDIQLNRPQNCTSLYFVRKHGADYRSYMPQMASNVQQDILDLVIPNLKKQLHELHLVTYNPVGVADGEMEEVSTNSVPQVEAFLASLSDDELLLDEENLDLKNVAFYCIKVEYNEQTVYLFRQFSKLKKLRKGYLARLINNQLVALENEFIGIDDTIDIALYDEKLYILNHISLERVFNYRDEYQRITQSAIDEIENKHVLTNMEQFREDCGRDVRAMKRFTDIMTKGRLPLFFENFDKVPAIVQSLGIDLQYDDEGKLIYRDKSQLFPIIYLMSDAYFKSLLAERTGIAKTEEVIQ